MAHHLCWCDRKHMIVARGRKAIRLGCVEFAVFYAIHKYLSHGRKKQIGSHALYDQVYHGVTNAPALNVLGMTVRNINLKLAYLNLKIVGRNHNIHSYYEIIELPKSVVQNETHNLTNQAKQNLFANKIKVDLETKRTEQTNATQRVLESV